MKEDCLSERTRAEDILLGSLGFAEEASIISVKPTSEGYEGTAKWQDGEEFQFEWADEVDDLQRWALDILKSN